MLSRWIGYVTMALIGAALAQAVANKAGKEIEKQFELIMFETSLCNHCAVFDDDVAKLYKSHSLAQMAPMVKVNLDEVGTGRYHLNKPIQMVPTFVVMQNGKEIGRISGMVNKFAFLAFVRDKLYPTTKIAKK